MKNELLKLGGILLCVRSSCQKRLHVPAANLIVFTGCREILAVRGEFNADDWSGMYAPGEWLAFEIVQ